MRSRIGDHIRLNARTHQRPVILFVVTGIPPFRYRRNLLWTLSPNMGSPRVAAVKPQVHLVHGVGTPDFTPVVPHRLPEHPPSPGLDVAGVAAESEVEVFTEGHCVSRKHLPCKSPDEDKDSPNSTNSTPAMTPRSREAVVQVLGGIPYRCDYGFADNSFHLMPCPGLTGVKRSRRRHTRVKRISVVCCLNRHELLPALERRCRDRRRFTIIKDDVTQH